MGSKFVAMGAEFVDRDAELRFLGLQIPVWRPF